MDGLDLVAAAVSLYPLTPVILITGKGNEEIAVKAIQAGAASYVPKGLLGRLLVETVQKVWAVARAERSHARLMDCMLQNDCSFVLHNDETLIAPLVNYLNRCIGRVGLCDKASGLRVSVALEEALNNAFFHGNLELASAHREGERKAYRRLVETRLETPPYRDRTIHVDANMSRTEAAFVIRDEGPGFDASQLPDPTDPENLEKASGRGLLLMKTFMDEMVFNDVGNQVTLIKRKAPAD
jgi:anti-sigma regulatory factor (Ser/Thr protein kinase)